MTFVQVIPGLWLGSCPETAQDVQRLKANCLISAVLNLQSDADIEVLELNWSDINRQYVRSQIQLRRIKIIDFNPLDLRDNLPRAVQTLHSLMEGGSATYVHCTAGASRAPTVVAAYLHKHREMELTGAVKLVKSLRICSPDADTIKKAFR